MYLVLARKLAVPQVKAQGLGPIATKLRREPICGDEPSNHLGNLPTTISNISPYVPLGNVNMKPPCGTTIRESCHPRHRIPLLS
jgi:hypothetical protein